MGKPVLPLTTERLKLRPFRVSDSDWLRRLYNRPEVQEFATGPEHFGILRTAQHIAGYSRGTGLNTHNALYTVIELDRAPIGTIGFWRWIADSQVVEIGGSLAPEYFRGGYAMESLNRMLDVAFGAYGLHKVIARMDCRNMRAAKLVTQRGCNSTVSSVSTSRFAASGWTRSPTGFSTPTPDQAPGRFPEPFP